MPSDNDTILDEKPEQHIAEFRPDDHVEPGDQEHLAKEKALVRKLDIFIAPVMMLLMLISYLDRSNIGFAATQGMTDDINLQGSQLNVCHGSPSIPK